MLFLYLRPFDAVLLPMRCQHKHSYQPLYFCTCCSSASSAGSVGRSFDHSARIFFLGPGFCTGACGALPRPSRDGAVLHEPRWTNESLWICPPCFLQQSELAAEESPDKLGASQLHRRKIISLNKQILQKTKHLEEVSVFFL